MRFECPNCGRNVPDQFVRNGLCPTCDWEKNVIIPKTELVEIIKSKLNLLLLAQILFCLAGLCMTMAAIDVLDKDLVNPPAKTEWEYCTFNTDGRVFVGQESLCIVYHDEDVATTNGVLSGFADKTFAPVPVLAVGDLLNKVGTDGWELCAVQGQDYYMRRPAGDLKLHCDGWKHDYFTLVYTNLN